MNYVIVETIALGMLKDVNAPRVLEKGCLITSYLKQK